MQLEAEAKDELPVQELDELAVLGSGSWGTALAYLFSRRCRHVWLWARSASDAESLQRARRNDRYLPGVTLPPNVDCTGSIEDAVSAAGVITIAVPSFGVQAVTESIRSRARQDTLLLSAAKGLECSTGRRLSQVVEQVMPGARERLAVLSGPNLAREAADGMPTATVIASAEPQVALRLQNWLTLPEFRIYTNPDLVGVEIGGALKNIIAIAAGITDGLGYGENTKAALLSRGLNEIRRLGVALGARDSTFSGLSGIGDLFATCASVQSRNHRVGVELGQGKKLPEILEGMDQIAEGVPTTTAALLLAERLGVELPITAKLHSVLFEGADPRECVSALMSRAPVEEGG